MSTTATTWRLACVAVLVRLLALIALSDSLRADPDGYAAFARSWSSSGFYGYVPGQPSAHRPPGYPAFLRLLSLGWEEAEPARARIVCGHLAAAALTVVLAGDVARRLGAGAFAPLAMLIVALDPLSIRSATLIMTETLFAALFAGLLAGWLRLSSGPGGAEGRRWLWLVITGLLLAAAALTRPIAWAVWGVLGFALAVASIRRSTSEPVPSSNAPNGARELQHAAAVETTNGREAAVPAGRHPLVAWALCLVVALIAAAPWALRNYRLLGVLVFTSTHGGYTLWLGQNPVYYAEVVAGPNAVWPAESFRRWTDENRGNTAGLSEIERDRYYRARALAWMRAHPVAVLRSMTYHIWSLWAPAPRKESLPVRWGCGVFYLSLYLLAGLGLRLPVLRQPPGLVALAALAGFTVVHAVYWSDVRMRAPLIVVLAALAAAGVNRWKRCR